MESLDQSQIEEGIEQTYESPEQSRESMYLEDEETNKYSSTAGPRIEQVTSFDYSVESTPSWQDNNMDKSTTTSASGRVYGHDRQRAQELLARFRAEHLDETVNSEQKKTTTSRTSRSAESSKRQTNYNTMGSAKSNPVPHYPVRYGNWERPRSPANGIVSPQKYALDLSDRRNTSLDHEKSRTDGSNEVDSRYEQDQVYMRPSVDKQGFIHPDAMTAPDQFDVDKSFENDVTGTGDVVDRTFTEGNSFFSCEASPNKTNEDLRLGASPRDAQKLNATGSLSGNPWMTDRDAARRYSEEDDAWVLGDEPEFQRGFAPYRSSKTSSSRRYVPSGTHSDKENDDGRFKATGSVQPTRTETSDNSFAEKMANRKARIESWKTRRLARQKAEMSGDDSWELGNEAEPKSNRDRTTSNGSRTRELAQDRPPRKDRVATSEEKSLSTLRDHYETPPARKGALSKHFDRDASKINDEEPEESKSWLEMKTAFSVDYSLKPANSEDWDEAWAKSQVSIINTSYGDINTSMSSTERDHELHMAFIDEEFGSHQPPSRRPLQQAQLVTPTKSDVSKVPTQVFDPFSSIDLNESSLSDIDVRERRNEINQKIEHMRRQQQGVSRGDIIQAVLRIPKTESAPESAPSRESSSPVIHSSAVLKNTGTRTAAYDSFELKPTLIEKRLEEASNHIKHKPSPTSITTKQDNRLDDSFASMGTTRRRLYHDTSFTIHDTEQDEDPQTNDNTSSTVKRRSRVSLFKGCIPFLRN
jgi:hypothetical protein